MIALSCSKISKTFGIDEILRDISFSINHGEKVGLIGLNGTGKSTLFRILTGEIPADGGDIFKAKEHTVGYLRQDNLLNEENQVLEEVLTIFKDLEIMEERLRSLEVEISDLGKEDAAEAGGASGAVGNTAERKNNTDAIGNATEEKSNSKARMSTSGSENDSTEKSGLGTTELLAQKMQQYSALLEEFDARGGYSYKSEAKGVLVGLGFSKEEFTQPIYQLSGGQKTRLSLGKLLLKTPDILLLDEPTNHLDIGAIQWLESFLRNYKGTMLLISHDRYFLDQIVTRTFELENKTLNIFNGNYSTFMKKKQEAFQQQLKKHLENTKEIEKEKDKIRRLRQHGTEKLMNRAKSKEKQFEKMDKEAAPLIGRKQANIRFKPQLESGHDVMFAKNLAKSFEEEALFDNVSFDIYRGEKIALIGPNGVGKSTLFKMILGELSYDRGEIKEGHHVMKAYYDQEMENLNHSKTVMDEIWDENPRLSHTEVRTYLGSFLFFGDDVFKEISVLSGGEKARVSLLKLILSKSNFIMLDEPTNHLDIQSKEVLEEALKNYLGTLFFISHDRYFINRVATKILELSPDGVITYLGNYDYYLQKKKEEQWALEDAQMELEDKPRTQTEKKQLQKKEREQQKALKKLKKSFEETEEAIAAQEAYLRELEEEMCKEEVYSDPEKSRKIQKDKQEGEAALEALYLEWEALEEEINKK